MRTVAHCGVLPQQPQQLLLLPLHRGNIPLDGCLARHRMIQLIINSFLIHAAAVQQPLTQLGQQVLREHEAESLREPCPYHVIELGLRYHDRETLYGRINRRVDKMVEMGLTEEVKAAREQGLTATAAQAIGCKELYSWLDGKETQEEALEKLKQSTRRYAKRQLTWFGTDQRMRWIEPDTLAAGETPLDKAMEILEKEGMA